jgi:hypothetical protein
MLPADALPVFSSVSHGMLKSSLSSDGSKPDYTRREVVKVVKLRGAEIALMRGFLA